MAELAKLDEYGHHYSFRFTKDERHPHWDGAVAGVIDCRGSKPSHVSIAVALDGHPEKGYDLIFWYATIDDAIDALNGWDYPDEPSPPGFIRDIQAQPLEEWEY